MTGTGQKLETVKEQESQSHGPGGLEVITLRGMGGAGRPQHVLSPH